MANTSPRSRLHKLLHRHPDPEPKNNETSSPTSSSGSPNSQRHARSRSASFRDAIGSRVHARSSSKSRSRGPSAEYPAVYGGKASATGSPHDVPPLPKIRPQSSLSHDFSTMSTSSPQSGGFGANQRRLDDPFQAHKPVADVSARRQSGGAGNTASNFHAISSPDERHVPRKADVNPPAVHGRSERVRAEPQSRSAKPPKPLPLAPDEFDYSLIAKFQQQEEATAVESALGRERGYLVKDSPIPVSLEGIVDLGHSEDTTVYERWAPAVMHETITENVHEIRTEMITREIHNHHYFHRILPIIDIEVLPARHFVPLQGGYAEISEDEVPGRGGKNAQWIIAETVSKMLPQSTGSITSRQFTARQFHGTDGEHKEYVTAEGIKRTETTWVHPPTIEMGGQHSGQTLPFHFNCADPASNGLRAKLPGGEVLGVSPLLAKQRRERMGAQHMSANGVDDVGSAIPPHKSLSANLASRTRPRPA